VTVKGFKKCISGATGRTDDMMWNDDEKDEDVRSKCEEDEGTNCEDEDSDTD
jgi:hypothetical protein